MRRILCLSLLAATSACAGNLLNGLESGRPESAAPCGNALQSFSRALWGPVVQVDCYGCHQAGGLAASLNAKLVFVPENTPNAVAANQAVLRAYAQKYGSLLVAKPSQQVAHVGGLVLAENSAELAQLKDFVANANQSLGTECAALDLATVQSASTALSARGQLRKASLRLAGRLPSSAEAQQVSGSAAMLGSTLDTYINSPAFWERFADEWNLAILTDRYLTNSGALALFKDTPTATWYEPASKWPSQALYQNAMTETNKALAREPLNILNYVVRNNLPFSDILAGSYTVVNPYAACALGVQNKVTFKTAVTCSPQDPNAYDAYDFQKLSLNTLGGVLTTRAYLNAHSTTPTNRNRHRVHQTLQAFMGIDILSFSKTRLSPTAVSDPNPTMTNAQCTVCHALMDPIAGTFQTYDAMGNVNNTPWYTDEFAPGFMGQPLPTGTTQPLQWSTAKMVADPRFARNTVNMVYTFLNGAPPVALSSDPNEAALPVNYQTYTVQEAMLQKFSEDFVAAGFNVRALIKEMVAHPSFALSGVQADPNSDVGAVAQNFVHQTVLSPQSLDLRISGVLGTAWADATGAHYLTNAFYPYYGGVDSVSVTTGVHDFSSMMSNISLRMAAQMACVAVPHALSADTSPAAVQARANLFPSFDLNTRNGTADVKANLQQLHWALLGEDVAANGPEVQADYAVFTQVQQQLMTAKSTTLPGACAVTQQLDGGAISQGLSSDPNATVQAWMATVAYMLGDIKFLTE